MNPDLPIWKALEHMLTPDQLADQAGSWERRTAVLAAIVHGWDVDEAVRFLAGPTAEPRGAGVRHIVQTDLCPAGDVGESVRRYIAAAAICAALAAAGCSSTTEGTPTTTADKAADLWDPCTGIPDNALRAANVDPASKESGVGGIQQSGWKICGWRGPEYSITAYSTARSVDEFEHKPGNVDFTDVTIAGRSGRQFRVEGASKQLDCNVVFPVQQGVVQLQVLGRASLDNPPEPCGVLARIGESIVPSFPK
ncbi:hypothetical protein B7C42_05575 [Nocardia cerradoensis]|uniref:DUF3558 domain-containing protein n=1 Tax=Nocardia cerradoensis TaxID=85688 RepID=A0A231H0K5_9NOCA|nr:DUF3558 domain-containing protein [Nocardia cerradoensis]OXR42376.1 hypothetical protein B7C42_05575 [Nocardia cerradoensis]